MDEDRDAKVQLASTWEGRMRQVAEREMSYERALQVALECVEITERYAAPPPQSMSPADPDAHLDAVINLASKLECEVRLAVYSLYHGDTLLERDQAVARLLDCGQRAMAPDATDPDR